MKLVKNQETQTLSLYELGGARLVLTLEYVDGGWTELYCGTATEEDIQNAINAARNQYPNGKLD